MSTETLFANLPGAVRELVGQSPVGSQLGASDEEKKEVANWIAKASDTSFVSNSKLPALNTELTSKTYLVGNEMTAADVALYGSLHPIISALQAPEYYVTPALTRYFDHIQHDSAIRTCSSAPGLVNFDISNAPKQERKLEAPVKKKKKDEAVAGTSSSEAAAAPATSSKKQKAPAAAAAAEEQPDAAETPAAGKKEKKEKVKKEPVAAGAAGGKKGESSKAGASGAAAAADSGDPTPSMIELRVGHIVDIKVHPDADGLYVEQIDVGEETGPRTVISGLVNYIPIEKMRDRYLVAVASHQAAPFSMSHRPQCNLKPANMRGIKSHAMVLCATSKDGKEAGIELVEPPPGSKVGERVYFEGYEDKEPLSQLNPKKKIFETIQPGFITLDTHEAAWVDPVTKTAHRIRTKDGVCKAPTFVGATLS